MQKYETNAGLCLLKSVSGLDPHTGDRQTCINSVLQYEVVICVVHANWMDLYSLCVSIVSLFA